jgi:hypothetical protein
MDGYDELVAEIDRIVNSPYPTQQKVSKNIRDDSQLSQADTSVASTRYSVHKLYRGRHITMGAVHAVPNR